MSLLDAISLYRRHSDAVQHGNDSAETTDVDEGRSQVVGLVNGEFEKFATVYISVFFTFLLEWNPFEHLDCTCNLMQRHKGLLYSKMDRNIIFLYLVMHERTPMIHVQVWDTVFVAYRKISTISRTCR